MDFPELMEDNIEKPDIEIKYGIVDKSNFGDRVNVYGNTLYEKTDSEIKSYVEGFGGFRIKAGDTIIVDPVDGAEERGFRFFISGTAIGLLLHQRGLVTLHASAIVIRGTAVGFIGHSGAGKSTTVASFYSRGYPVLTDDILALDIKRGRVISYSGSQHIKMTPDSVGEVLKNNHEKLPKVYPSDAKVLYDTGGSISASIFPVQCLYLLDYGSEDINHKMPFRSEITGANACMELIRHSYSLRLLGKNASSSQHLRRISKIAQTIPVYKLHRRRELEDISSIVSFVEEQQL